MKDSVGSIQRGPPGALPIGVDRTQTKLKKFLYDQQTSLDRIQILISRSTGIGQLVSCKARSLGASLTKLVQILNLLEIRATEASKQMNSEMQKLTKQGVNENKLMKSLTEQSTKDTKFMMIIALISAIFLPATFFAVSIKSLLHMFDS